MYQAVVSGYHCCPKQIEVAAGMVGLWGRANKSNQSTAMTRCWSDVPCAKQKGGRRKLRLKWRNSVEGQLT